MRALIACAAALAAAPVGAEVTDDPGVSLASVMERLRESPGFRADFVEVREIALLKEPLQTEGTLYFVPPDRLARVTHEPEPALMVIEGDRLLTRDALGVEELDLAAQPRARRLVDQLTVLLRGDLEALHEAYEARFSSENATWQLDLTPRDVVAREVIGRVSLRGERERLEEMQFIDASGDRTRTRFHNVDARYVFGEEELRQIFPAP